MIFILFCVVLPALIALGTSLLACEIEKDKWQPYKRREEVLETPEERNTWYKPHEEVPAIIDLDPILEGIKEDPEAPQAINVQLDRGAYMPERAHEADAGYDIRTPVKFGLLPEQYAVIDTGVHIAIPQGYVGFLKSKSGLNIKNSIVGEGVIDSGYTGSIKVKLYNFGSRNKMFKLGDKIIQLVILPVYTPKLRQVDKLDVTERGNHGFGSTGR